MARAAPDDPIFFTRPQFGTPQSQLPQHQALLGPLSEEWKSVMPDPTALMLASVDPGLVVGAYGGWNELERAGEEIYAALKTGEPSTQQILQLVDAGKSSTMAVFERLTGADTVKVLRAVVGQVAMTVGFIGETMLAVRNLYAEPLAAVIGTLQLVNKIIASPYFQAALSGISAVPIIGWIVAAIAAVLTVIAKIAAYVRKKRIKKMTAELAKRSFVPLLSADPNMQKAYNELGVSFLLKRLEEYNLWLAFMPPYNYPSSNVRNFFVVEAARDPDLPYDYEVEGGQRVPLASAWYLSGAPLGLGMCPGSLELYRHVEFVTGGGGGMPQTTGRFMVTARQASAQLWQTILRGGDPPLFAIDTAYHRDAWDRYVHAQFEYAEECIITGFTVSESSTPCSTQHYCYDERGNICRSKDIGKKVTWPGGPGGVTHFSEFILWLTQEFWGRGANKDSFPYDVRDTKKEWNPDNFYYQNTIYAEALRQLREQQWSMVGDYEAMYVHPNKEFEDTYTGKIITSSRGIFPALANDAQMRKKWVETVTRILNDPNLWRHVNWRDVPAYRYYGQSPREILRQKWESQIKGTLAAPGMARPPMPGGKDDYPPPPPPELPGQERAILQLVPGLVRPVPTRTPPPLASKIMFGGSLVAAGFAGGIHHYNKYGRVFFS